MKLFHHHSHAPLSSVLPDETTDSAREIKKTVKIGCIVNAFLMLVKIAGGWLGHSDALTADGFHSLNDLGADLIMLLFVGISYKAADGRFPYGYGKFETFSSFLISTLLIVVAVMIGWEAVESIAGYARGEVLPQPDTWTLWVVLFAMACKEGLYRFYSHSAKKVSSNALMANAWHHRSDALASVATLTGVGAARFLGEGFRILDPVASLLIALFILLPAVNLWRPAFLELMDRSLPRKDVEKARKILLADNAVSDVVYIRTRKNGHHLVFDAGVVFRPEMSAQDAADSVAGIKNSFKEAFCPHVLVSVTPVS